MYHQRMIEQYSPQELDRIATIITDGPYRHSPDELPGLHAYPEHKDRLFMDSPGPERLSPKRLLVRDGPWHIAGHANREGQIDIDPDVPLETFYRPEDTLIQTKNHSQLLYDQYGRPIHPAWRQLLSDKRIGLPTGLGFFWRYGENQTVDPIVHRQMTPEDEPEFLLIQRSRGLQWALPGGFRDKADDTSAMTAFRELAEETGLQPTGASHEEVMDKRPVGRRDTIHAWTRNTAVLIHANREYLYDVKPEARDDAVDAGWFTIRAMQEKLSMFDAHAQYIGAAMMRLQA
jgi:8-oxo-dGTP pyrophosphatase MutT (NUDIX family)